MKAHRHIITSPTITLMLAVSFSALAAASETEQSENKQSGHETSGETTQASESVSSAAVAVQIEELYVEACKLVEDGDTDTAKEKLKIAKQKSAQISAADHVRIVEDLKKLADNDYMPAQYVLYILYGDGSNGVDKDMKESKHWLRKAALNGCEIARKFLYLSTNYLQPDGTVATDTESEIVLGVIYYQGRGVEEDVEEAVKHFQAAADAGDSNGLVLLGLAAKEGNANAQFCLARYFLAGKIVPRNYEKGHEWLNMAVEQGHIQAQLLLGMCYMNNKYGVPANPHKGLQLIMHAADQGEPYALAVLGTMYYEGNGVLKNQVKGISLLCEAHEKGCKIATDYLHKNGIMTRSK